MSAIQPTARIAQELSVAESQVEAAVNLLDGGATVPFVARYRKEVTGGLDDAQLRHLEERLTYLRDLEARRSVIVESIAGQGKLTEELAIAIENADTRARLEDLYLPYRPKRRTKAQIAREAGLEPLARKLRDDPRSDPLVAARDFVDPGHAVPDSDAALEGARHILMEDFSQHADLIENIRRYLREHAVVKSTLIKGKEEEGSKFSDYFDYRESLARIPSHRGLAMFRGRNLGVLRVQLLEDDQAEDRHGQGWCESRVAREFQITNQGRPADAWLLETVRLTWKVKIHTRLELELLNELRERAEEEAIRVFASNLRDLILAAPAGPRPTMGLDPGFRTGVKVAIVDGTGKLLSTTTIYPHPPQKRWDEAVQVLCSLIERHNVELIAIGNGTASRETERLVERVQACAGKPGLQRLVVSEAGASVYSASALASDELPDLDVSLRGAVSIARRLQDPMAELVKIEPRSIGVGQYQHDVSQTHLARTLDAIVEDCVNAVGVDVNMASVPLLRHVAGLNQTLAENVVASRDAKGAYRKRADLLRVPRLGARTYEQCAGFLRIRGGTNPLDASAVHPEAYPVVERIVRERGRAIEAIIGNDDFLRSLRPSDYVDERFGVPTIVDIIGELEKPGRDPRPEFRTAVFREGVEKVEDLEPDMVLEGIVSNVTNFGAFVDIGVHQDGLVHISAMADRFVRDPREIVKTGDVVKVKVLEIDLQRRRIALSMRLQDKASPDTSAAGRVSNAERTPPQRASRGQASPPGGALADAFQRARKGRQ